jgi:O-antigen/teichoic acid export membrane protein
MKTIMKFLPIFLGPIGTQFALIFSGVLISRMVGVFDRGTLAIFMVLISLSVIFGGTAASQLASIYSTVESREKVFFGIINKVKYFMLSASIFMSLLTLFSLKNFFVSVTVFLAINSQITTSILIGIMRGKKLFIQSSILQISQPFLFSVIITVSYLTVKLNILQIITLWTVLYFFVALIGFSMIIGLDKLRLNYKKDNTALFPDFRSRSFKSLLSTYSPLESYRIDQLLNYLMFSASGLGLYVTGIAFANASKLIGQSLSGLVPNWILDKNTKFMTKIIYSSSACLIVAVIFSILGKISVVWIFGDQFQEAEKLVVPLALSGGFMGIRTILVEVYRVQQKEIVATRIEVCAFLFYLFLIIVFKSQSDQIFICWALFMASALSVVLLTIYQLYIYRISKRKFLTSHSNLCL